jgi:hypothetical protein
VEDADDEFGASDTVWAFDGSYGFGMAVFEDELSIIFDEHKHIQDEYASHDCEIVRDGSKFCETVLEVDKNLGTDLDIEDIEALDFACTTEDGFINCALTRRADIPGGTPQIAVTIPLEDGEFDSSDALMAFDGSYQFSIELFDEELNIVFDESKHAQDEVGSFLCDLDRSGAEFCKEPIEVDRNIGTEEPFDVQHAFNFSCTAKTENTAL